MASLPSWTLLAKTVLVLAAGLGLHRLLEPLRQDRHLHLPDLERLPDLLGGMGLVGAGLLVALNR
jgi:multicomponent Na+:H+ antiporter subunit D